MKKLPPVRLKILLICIFMLIGLIPPAVHGRVLRESFAQTEAEAKRIELQNRCLILADRLAGSAYLGSIDKDMLVDSGIDMLADNYNGRIVIIDSSFRIIRDTFNAANGKLSIAEDVIKGFSGETLSRYNRDKNYIVQVQPVYSINDKKKVEGVILFTSSTENMRSRVEDVFERSLIFYITICVILIAVSAFASSAIVKPFTVLRDQLKKAVDGDMSYSVDENTYVLTSQISSTINSTLEKLKAVDQSREEFVANVSHELKTPITSIRVLADSLMCMEEVPAELYKEFMNDISDEIDRESKIIDDLLSLVKLDKAATELNTEQVDINSLLKLILKRLRPIAAKRNIEVTLETVREVSAEVDETKLSLALNNLIENAIKYNKESGWVKVSLDADHKFFYIKVMDSGIGISEEFQEAIFERFYRIDKARSRETGGTGLGLAITRNIILRHNGIIKVSSKEGEGTTFTVRLPLTYIKA